MRPLRPTLCTPGLAVLLALAPAPGAIAQAPAPPTGTAPSADEQAVRGLVAEFVRAFNAGDAAAVAATFAEDAEVLLDEDEDGPLIGRDAIRAQFEGLLADGPIGTIAVESQSIRMIGPDTAIEKGTTRLTPRPAPDGKPAASAARPETSRYTAVHVKRNGKWLQFLVRDTTIEATTPHDHLEPLAWLAGEWVDESDQAVVHTSCRWDDGGAYLLRDITARIAGRPVVTASQRIGWDPLHKAIKSWVFDSEGGHSEALWTRSGGDRWLIKSAGVASDGATLSATHVLTRVNDSTLTWASVDRTRDGEAEPDIAPITIVRRPPPPQSRAAAAAATAPTPAP